MVEGAARPMIHRDVETRNVAPLADGDLTGAIEILRAASLHNLRDENFLREELLLSVGLNGEALEEFPDALYPWCGTGIRSWQYPLQFSKYLVFLSTRNILSYVEIGSRHGGTFIIVVEYLRRFCNLYKAVAIDIEETAIMRKYSTITAGVEYRLEDSHSPDATAYLGSEAWDLAFVDGDHSYEGCLADFIAVRDRSKLIGLHDIASTVCPGVRRVWDEIRKVVPSRLRLEFTDQYRNVYDRLNASFLGIGVVDWESSP